MRKLLRRLRSQRGQGLILVVGLLSVIMAISVIVVDFGLWFSEHRGAQKDADAAALAGAQAYLADPDLKDPNTVNIAFSDGVKWAVKNGIDPAKIDSAHTSNCSDGNSCIDVGKGDCREDGTDASMPWVEAKVRHNSSALFGGLFGLVAPDIGATARACVGSARTLENLSPIAIQTGFVTDPKCPNYGQPLSDCLEPDPDNPGHTRPVYGKACILKTGGNDDQCAGFYSGQRGQLTIGNLACDQTSKNTLRDDFHYGTMAACTVGNEVNTGTGTITGLLSGLNDRLHEEGLCDTDFGIEQNGVRNGYDDFNEVFSLAGAAPGEPIVPSADHLFAQNSCSITRQDSNGQSHTYSPRAINLVLVDEFDKGQKTATMKGFAGFYVVGCFDDSQAAATKTAIDQHLSNIDPYLNRCDHPTGQSDIIGIFVETLAPATNVGNPDKSLPLSVVLVK